MARARATDNARPRSKAGLIEEIGRGIEQFQDIIASIEDCSREGFPYRDAARAKAELQLRECVRRIFGERSTEFQTYRNHRLRISNRSEIAQSLTVVKQLIHSLEEKKLELQGIKSPAPEEETIPQAAVPPPLSLVPPSAPTPPPAGAAPVTPAPPTIVSVSMTANPGPPVPPVVVSPPSSPPPTVEPPAVVLAEPQQPAPPLQTGQSPTSSPSAEWMPPAPSKPSTPPPSTAVADRQPTSGTQPATPHEQAQPARLTQSWPSPSVPVAPAIESFTVQDPLELIRKVCLRFHAVTRQLRLRKDYRATLEVEDDDDLQDLLCALLRVEFDEVGVDEWVPPYAPGVPRRAFLLHRDQIAVSAKKTRPGLTTKELADQVVADSAHYGARDTCTTLFCFIYDPEGRIGSPKRLETDLTSVSDRYTIEVLVAPK